MVNILVGFADPAAVSQSPQEVYIMRIAFFVAMSILIVAAFVLTVPAAAQSCFKGRPADLCSTFFLTEFGVRVTSDPTLRSINPAATLLAGFMVNTGTSFALGATVALEVGAGQHPEPSFNVPFGPRFRYWITRDYHVDAAITAAINNGGVNRYTLNIILMYRDEIGIEAGLLQVKYPSGPNPAPAPFFGFRAGSYPGLIGIVGSIVLVMVANPG